MGLDSYIFKTTKKEQHEKMYEIFSTKVKGRTKGIPLGDMVLFVDDDANYMDELSPDIYWRKFNHVTAWISEKVLCNPKDKFQKSICVITKNDFSRLLDDCHKVLNHCITSDGTIVIDEKFCKEIFPSFQTLFGGSTDYDEFFIKELKTVITDLNNLLLTSNNNDASFIFCMDF